MNDLATLRDHLAGLRAQATAALECVDRLIERVQKAEAQMSEEDEPKQKKTPPTFGGAK
jgi:hypothetical protein